MNTNTEIATESPIERQVNTLDAELAELRTALAAKDRQIETQSEIIHRYGGDTLGKLESQLGNVRAELEKERAHVAKLQSERDKACAEAASMRRDAVHHGDMIRERDDARSRRNNAQAKLDTIDRQLDEHSVAKVATEMRVKAVLAEHKYWGDSLREIQRLLDDAGVPVGNGKAIERVVALITIRNGLHAEIADLERASDMAEARHKETIERHERDYGTRESLRAQIDAMHMEHEATKATLAQVDAQLADARTEAALARAECVDLGKSVQELTQKLCEADDAIMKAGHGAGQLREAIANLLDVLAGQGARTSWQEALEITCTLSGRYCEPYISLFDPATSLADEKRRHDATAREAIELIDKANADARERIGQAQADRDASDRELASTNEEIAEIMAAARRSFGSRMDQLEVEHPHDRGRRVAIVLDSLVDQLRAMRIDHKAGVDDMAAQAGQVRALQAKNESLGQHAAACEARLRQIDRDMATVRTALAEEIQAHRNAVDEVSKIRNANASLANDARDAKEAALAATREAIAHRDACSIAEHALTDARAGVAKLAAELGETRAKLAAQHLETEFANATTAHVQAEYRKLTAIITYERTLRGAGVQA